MTIQMRVIVLALIVLATTLVVADVNDSDLRKAYEDIEALLAKKLSANYDNIPLILEKVSRFLKKEEGWHVFRKKRSSLIYALKSLIDLKIIDGTEACTDVAYKALLKCDRATEGRAHKSWTVSLHSHPSKKSYVDSIVHHYSLKHAKKCLSSHANKFDLALSRISASSREAIEPFLNKIVFRHLCGFAPSHQNMDDCNLESEPIAERLPAIISFKHADAPLILEELDHVTRGTPDELILHRSIRAPSEASEVELTRIIIEHLLAPCKEYHNALSTKVFAEAQFDIVMLESRSFDKSVTNFFLGWANFRLCSAMIKNPSVLSKFVLQYTSRGI